MYEYARMVKGAVLHKVWFTACFCPYFSDEISEDLAFYRISRFVPYVKGT